MDRNQLDSPLPLKIIYVNRYIDFKSTILVYMVFNGKGQITGCGLQNRLFFPFFIGVSSIAIICFSVCCS